MCYRYTEEEAAAPAIALGIGLQLTNILRDVGEDLERGRIYLPQVILVYKWQGCKYKDVLTHTYIHT